MAGERAETHEPPTPSDLDIARAYAAGTAWPRGIHDWIGTPYATDPSDPDEARQAAADTVRYMESRPASAEEVTPVYVRYYETLEHMPSLQQKNARQLVDEWAEAELQSDKTRAYDIEEELTRRVLPNGYKHSKKASIGDAEKAAYMLEAVRHRKDRLKGQRLAAELAELAQEPLPAEYPIVRLEVPVPSDEAEAPTPPGVRPGAPPEPEAVEAGPALTDELLAEPPKPPVQRRPAAWRLLGPTLGAKFTTYFYDPERGLRRRILAGAVLAGVGALACALCAVGASEIDHDNGRGILTPSTPTKAPTPHVSPSVVGPTPSIEPTLIPPTSIEQIVPATGHRYVWGAFASVYGADHATDEILHRIDILCDNGWDVDTWGNTDGQWGISSIETPSGRDITDVPGQISALNYADLLERGTTGGTSVEPAGLVGIPPVAIEPELNSLRPSLQPSPSVNGIAVIATPVVAYMSMLASRLRIPGQRKKRQKRAQ